MENDCGLLFWHEHGLRPDIEHAMAIDNVQVGILVLILTLDK